MTAIAVFLADPQAELDYQFDWSTWLSVGESIVGFSVDAPTDLTVGSGGLAPSQSGGKVTYWLTGGVVNQSYNVTCHITTDAGRQEDATHRFHIVDYSDSGTVTGGTTSSGDIDGGTP